MQVLGRLKLHPGWHCVLETQAAHSKERSLHNPSNPLHSFTYVCVSGYKTGSATPPLLLTIESIIEIWPEQLKTQIPSTTAEYLCMREVS
jgi:hypothetical protein